MTLLFIAILLRTVSRPIHFLKYFHPPHKLTWLNSSKAHALAPENQRIQDHDRHENFIYLPRDENNTSKG